MLSLLKAGRIFKDKVGFFTNWNDDDDDHDDAADDDGDDDDYDPLLIENWFEV